MTYRTRAFIILSLVAATLYSAYANSESPKPADDSDQTHVIQDLIPCATDGDCRNTEYCDTAAQLCAEKKQYGDPCGGDQFCQSGVCCQSGPDTPQCPVGGGICASCSSSASCGKEFCMRNAGPAPVCTWGVRPTAASCNETSQCLSGLYCDVTTSSCQPTLAFGSPCTTIDACGTDLACKAGICAWAGDVGQACTSQSDCRSTLQCDATSQACSFVRNDDACVSDDSCGGVTFCAFTLPAATGGQCSTKLPPGSFCVRDDMCISGLCNPNGLCGDADSCSVDADCNPKGGFCFNGWCYNALGVGQPCNAAVQCVSGVCEKTPFSVGGTYCQECHADNSGCPTGQYCSGSAIKVCSPLKDENLPCSGSNECTSGYCGSGLCKTKAAAGGACGVAEDCQAGLSCITNICSALSGPGGPCSSPANCQPPLGCINMICTPTCSSNAQCPLTQWCNTASQTCLTGLRPSGVSCSSDSQCQGGYCNKNANPAVCGTRAGAGSPCMTYMDCMQGLSCTSSVCRTRCSSSSSSACTPTEYCSGRVCVPKKSLGATCASAGECASAQCVNWKCVVKPACVKDQDCPAGAYCYGGACLTGARPNGVVCNDNNSCQSGYCSKSQGNTCACCRGAAGGACVDGNDCGGGLSCEAGVCSTGCFADTQCAWNQFCLDGKCMIKLNNGQSCGGDSQCSSGYCAVQSNTCAVKQSVGNPCVMDQDCTAGLYCLQNRCRATCMSDSACPPGTWCQPVLGAPWRCSIAPRPNGKPCTNNPDCSSNYCNPATQTCTSQSPLGGACVDSFDCIPGLACLAQICVRKCVTGQDCPVNQWCDGSACWTGPRPDGTACALPTQCLSGMCVDNKCTSLAAQGAACSTSSDCQPNLYCLAFQCAPYCSSSPQCPAFPNAYCDPTSRMCVVGKKPDGLSCAADLECSSGFCNAQTRVCATRSGEGGSCGSVLDCQAALGCFSGSCRRACNNDGACGASAYCSLQGYCVAGLKPNGYPCRWSSDCSSTYCSPTAMKCADKGKAGARCATSSDCANGYICSAEKVCRPCQTDYDCPAQQWCDAAAGQCIYGRKPDGVKCNVNGECVSNYCNVITKVCTTQSLQGGACLTDSDCKNPMYCVSGQCWLRCFDDAGCPFNYVCDLLQAKCTLCSGLGCGGGLVPLPAPNPVPQPVPLDGGAPLEAGPITIYSTITSSSVSRSSIKAADKPGK